jgi:hypothetical protein
MPCYRPLEGFRSKARNPNGKRNIVFSRSEGYSDLKVTIPCGRCVGCRLEHSRIWAIRCMHEAQLHEYNTFITLTYNDDHLPKTKTVPTLNKKDLQNFMKRLRRNIELAREKAGLPEKKIKYYACGEYGDNFGRPHYHICLFNHDFTDKKPWKKTKTGNKIYVSEVLNKIWSDPKTKEQIGWATIGELTFETAAYTARYCMKKRKGKDSQSYYEVYTDLETGEVISRAPEFSLMSRRPGIGKEWYDKYKKEVYPLDRVYLNGHFVKPPKYYDKQHEILSPKEMAIVKGKRKYNAKNKLDNSLARLKTREYCKEKQITSLQRSKE